MHAYVPGLPRRMGVILAQQFARPDYTREKYKARHAVICEVQNERNRLPVDASEAMIYQAADSIVREVWSYSASGKDSSYVVDGIAMLCRKLGFPAPLGETDRERIARGVDRNWWIRAMRKEHARRFEHVAIQLGFTSYKAGVYLSNESAERQRKRNNDNAKLLANTQVQNEHGQTYTLAELAALGPADKAIRRGELMTRIRGFEEIAQDLGHVGMFWTITAPSKFHAVLSKSGDMNPKYEGASPRDAQAYLCKVWQRIRAKLHRQDIQPYGFRIAEPHHDGFPHWHMLLFVAPEQAAAMEKIVRAYALAEDGHEPGAQENRVKLVNIDAGKGSAAGYIIKYVCKNVDGEGVGDHKTRDGWTVVTDLLGNEEITPSQRVALWSQLHGIRQFQQIGGAPIGVWRELRRVSADAVRNAPEPVKEAWKSAQRHGDELATFSGFIRACGGPTVGRGTCIKVARRHTEIIGKYATYTELKPCGVYSVDNVNAVYESVRFRWTRIDKGGAGVAFDVPWTGVNNCTVPGANAPWVNPKPAPDWLKNKKFSSDVDEFAARWKARE